MITTKITYNIVCNECGTTLPTNAASARLAWEEARELGWKTYISMWAEFHYCPHCADAKNAILKEYYGG